MATNSFQKQLPVKSENGHPGKKAAKRNRLFRRIAPLVAAGALALGCGGTQKPQACPMDKEGEYIIAGNCTVPEKPVRKDEESIAEKEGSVPKSGWEHLEAQFPEADIKGVQEGFTQIVLGIGHIGLEFLEVKGDISERSHIYLEDGERLERTYGSISLVVQPEYENSEIKISVLSSSPEPNFSPHLLLQRDLRINDFEGRFSPEGKVFYSHQEEGPLKLPGPSGDGQRCVYSSSVRAENSSGSHVAEFELKTPLPGIQKVLAVYDSENAKIVVGNSGQEGLSLLEMSLNAKWPEGTQIRLALWERKGFIYLIFAPELPLPSHDITVLFTKGAPNTKDIKFTSATFTYLDAKEAVEELLNELDSKENAEKEGEQ